MSPDVPEYVVAVRPLYGGSDYLLASGVLGNDVTFTTAEGVHAALRPDTGLVILETPANPSLELVFRISELFGLPIEAIFSREPFRPLSEEIYGRPNTERVSGGTAVGAREGVRP